MPIQGEEEQRLEATLKTLSDQITTASRTPGMTDAVYQNQIEKFLQRRNAAIESYMKSKGWEVQGELLVTRHPESKGKEKMYGLSPDATPSNSGVASLTPAKGNEATHAKNYMHLLLRDSKKPVAFARSNMIRAGMLCNMIMQSVIGSGVKVTECKNSSDFQETQGKVSAASTTPIPETPEELAVWRNKDEALSSARKELSQLVNTESAQIIIDHGGRYDGSESAGISKKSVQDRLHSIDTLLTKENQAPEETQKTSVTWLVGHGKTSSNYFKSIFGEKYAFDFSTTKSIYLVKDKDGNTFNFSPPGAIKINNQGKLEGVFHKEEHLLLRNRNDAPKEEVHQEKKGSFLSKLAGNNANRFSSTWFIQKLTKKQIGQTQNFSAEVKERLEVRTNERLEKESKIAEEKLMAQTAVTESINKLTQSDNKQEEATENKLFEGPTRSRR